jgi:hypothetical protein
MVSIVVNGWAQFRPDRGPVEVGQPQLSAYRPVDLLCEAGRQPASRTMSSRYGTPEPAAAAQTAIELPRQAASSAVSYPAAVVGGRDSVAHHSLYAADEEAELAVQLTCFMIVHLLPLGLPLQ